MNRSPEVDYAIKCARLRMAPWGLMLANQVELMEIRAKELEEALAKSETPKRAEAAEADSARHKRNEELQMERAIKAEARVKELDKLIGHISLACGFPIVSDLGQVTDTICKRIARVDAKVAELEAQNARLRAALLKLRAAADHAEIWLTSCLDCKYWMWSEYQHEAATEARDELKAALNGEEASK